ncbi:hypothetical protein FO519_007616 [Halicephalobus sp. NKZ332]|nr:hypothetical protein FO519_007616 [Halicephalobus sp. NKZ332]
MEKKKFECLRENWCGVQVPPTDENSKIYKQCDFIRNFVHLQAMKSCQCLIFQKKIYALVGVCGFLGTVPVDNPNGSLLIFVNPHSGAGKGIEVFAEKLRPKILEARLCYDLVITERPNHARDVVKSRLDLFTFDAIVIVSGDGLIFEVVNGILEKEGGDELLQKIPFGICPTGSGNGLLASVYYAKDLPQTMPMFFDNAISIISDLKSRAYPINLTHIETDKNHFGSFMSIGWGLLADIDIESERYRAILGGSRFFLGAIIRVFGSLRSYRGKLSFLEAGPSEVAAEESFPVFEKGAQDEDCPSYRSRKSTVTGSTVTVNGMNSDGYLWRRYEKHGGVASGLKDTIPSNWTTIEDEFLFVYVTSVTHISPGNNYNPNAKLKDNRLHLTYALRKDVTSRMSLAKFLDSITTSKHLSFDFCRSVSVTSLRLEPIDTGSYIVVDGEVVDCQRLQATASDLNMFVMCN